MSTTAPLTTEELAAIGETVLDLVGASIMMRHASPVGMLDYGFAPTVEDHVSRHIVHDLLAWIGRRGDERDEAEARLCAWVGTYWLPGQLARMEPAA